MANVGDIVKIVSGPSRYIGYKAKVIAEIPFRQGNSYRVQIIIDGTETRIIRHVAVKDCELITNENG